MVLDELSVPIVLAPLAGGPSTPELAAAVSEAGGLGFVASGYLSASALGERIARTRELTARPFGVNVFVPSRAPADPAAYAPFVERLRREAARLGAEVGEPRFDDDDWEAKLQLLAGDPARVVSFTFGCPPAEVVSRLRGAGSEVWVTITSPAEAREAVGAGADGLVVQGAEAGGHRASFSDADDAPVYGLLALLQLVRRVVDVPLVGTGGIATGAAVAAVLAAGARAAQVGTAFMRCPEAGTAEVHRAALASDGPTALTRAFTGRLARGIRNRFMDEHGADAPIAYPELHHVTSPLRRAGRERGDADVVNLWAGEAHALADERPAAEVVRTLASDAQRALEEALSRSGRDRALG
jgi:nitronate monooxygenase